MPRAHRTYIPGQYWHLTHRCHNKSFLLRAREDRRNWTQWAVKAYKRYYFTILNYCVTSNHIHILILYTKGQDSIARSMQLVQGNTAQYYNHRKKRSNAYWGDRYSATAIESGIHLRNCFAYIELKMIRAGAVNDPINWDFCGYQDIQRYRKRNVLIYYDALCSTFGANNMNHMKNLQIEMIENYQSKYGLKRCSEWTEAIAIGSPQYLENFRMQVKRKGVFAEKENAFGDSHFICETQAPYGEGFSTKISSIEGDNRWFILDFREHC